MSLMRYDPILLQYSVGDTILPLTYTEVRLLNLLRFYAGRTVALRDLEALLYHGHCTHHAIYVHMQRLRDKLRVVHPRVGQWIVHDYNVGYRWEEPC